MPPTPPHATHREGSRDGRPPLGRDASSERAWRREGGAEEPARERPRLNLAPRSAAPAAGGAAGGASKASVFGAARPREEVLKEQGRDAVKEDLRLEHEAVDRWAGRGRSCGRVGGGQPAMQSGSWHTLAACLVGMPAARLRLPA